MHICDPRMWQEGGKFKTSLACKVRPISKVRENGKGDGGAGKRKERGKDGVREKKGDKESSNWKHFLKI